MNDETQIPEQGKAPKANPERYNRQTRLQSWGRRGQERLSNSTVLVVGAGGLGSPALLCLAGAGVGRIRIADDDIVSMDNLQRQTIYRESDIDLPKADAARTRLAELNSEISVETFRERFEPHNGRRLLSGVDLVLDCSDNLSTRFLVHDLCFEKGIALVQAAVYTWEGQLQSFRFDRSKGEGCWRCLWDEAPDDDCVDSCADVGIAGTVTGTLGAMQANLALRILLGLSSPGTGTLTTVDLQDFATSRIRWKKRPDCPLCAGTQLRDIGRGSLMQEQVQTRNVPQAPSNAPDYPKRLRPIPMAQKGVLSEIAVKVPLISFAELPALSDYAIIDIREDSEFRDNDYLPFPDPNRIVKMPFSELNGLPANELLNKISGNLESKQHKRQPGNIDSVNAKVVVVMCAGGYRSRSLIEQIIEGEAMTGEVIGDGTVFKSLDGGINAIRNGGRLPLRL